jgi:hypothetical protein
MAFNFIINLRFNKEKDENQYLNVTISEPNGEFRGVEQIIIEDQES